jgi:hypothetical protein
MAELAGVGEAAGAGESVALGEVNISAPNDREYVWTLDGNMAPVAQPVLHESVHVSHSSSMTTGAAAQYVTG